MKTKKENPVLLLLKWAEKDRGFLIASVICAFLGGLLAIGPYIGIERSISMSQLMQARSPATTDELVDIREVAVDKALPKEERIAAFLHQIKNPYRFRCGDFVVNAAFANNGVTLEECLQGILR